MEHPLTQQWTNNGNSSVLDITPMVRAAAAGDDTAFGMLADLYRSAAQRVAHGIMRTEEAAADAVQDALLKAYRAMPRYQNGNFYAWLMRIVTNTCYDHLRRQKRRPALSLDELCEPAESDLMSTHAGDDPEWLALRKEVRAELMQAIGSLPAWHRHVVILVDVYGYNYTETAAILRLPVGTVKSRLSRARVALRDRLTEIGLVPGGRRLHH